MQLRKSALTLEPVSAMLLIHNGEESDGKMPSAKYLSTVKEAL
jgi:hypothetical protein